MGNEYEEKASKMKISNDQKNNFEKFHKDNFKDDISIFESDDEKNIEMTNNKQGKILN